MANSLARTGMKPELQEDYKMIIRIALAGLFALSLIAGPAAAHSGGTNAQGCHAGSQPYHCH
jgi:hypothetical protein